MHGRLRYVLHCLQHFTAVYCPVVREHLKYENLSPNYFRNYINLVKEHVESNISELIPDCIDLVFDNKSTPDAHYASISATFPTKNGGRFEAVCVALYPLENESRKDADEHIIFIALVLSVYSKSMNDVVAVIANKCSTDLRTY